jgi:hypothetical protein
MTGTRLVTKRNQTGSIVHPDDEEKLLAQLLPFMVVRYDEASVVYRLCLTRLRRKGFNRRAPKAIAKYRMEMVERLRLSRTKEEK